MKKTLLIAAVIGLLAGVANAGNSRVPVPVKPKPPIKTPIKAPEINPASVGSALTLLLGGLTVLRSRVGKK